MLHKGIIVGTEQEISIKNVFNVVMYKTNTTSKLFLDYFLRYLLSNKMIQEATGFLDEFKQLKYFSHSIEILLHELLETEADKNSAVILPTLINFIESSYPEIYLNVIVSCARKSEVCLWQFLFSVVGDATRLFHKCLLNNRIDTATSYLLIIQTLYPISISGKCATELLDKALSLEDYEVSKELLRFLSSIQDRVPFIDDSNTDPVI